MEHENIILAGTCLGVLILVELQEVADRSNMDCRTLQVQELTPLHGGMTAGTGVDESFDIGRQCAPHKMLTKNVYCRRHNVRYIRARVCDVAKAKLEVAISIWNPDSTITLQNKPFELRRRLSVGSAS